MSVMTQLRKAFGGAAIAAPKEKGGGPEIHHPKGTDMLQQSMVLPGKKNNGHPASEGVFSAADTQKARRARAWFEDRLKQGRKDVFTEAIELTPVIAETLLAVNPDNRALKPGKLVQMAADVQEGRWEFNGETLKVSVEGLLNDGQHRCHAVIEAGQSIRTLITFGVSRQSRVTVDQGSVRTTGDYLSMEGVPSGNHCASVATLIFLVGETGYVKKNPEKMPTKAQVRETYFSNPRILDSIHAVPRGGASLVGGLTNLAFCHFMFALKDRAAADAFIRQMVRGEELRASDPIYVARQRLMTDKRLRAEEKIEIIFRAWNAVRTRRPLRSIPIHNRLPGIER